MCTISDGESYEKTIVFGGITHCKVLKKSHIKGSFGAQDNQPGYFKSKNKLLYSKNRKQFDTVSSKNMVK